MGAAAGDDASPAWIRARREHRESLSALLETIGAAGDEAWRRPVAPGKWTPAQIAEHLALVYEALARDLAGEGSAQARVGPGLQRLLRWVLLPHILFHRSLPVRARAPREARPSDAGLPRSEAAARLPELAERFERRLEEVRPVGRPLHHPYFGPISPLQALRFCAVHLEHHHRQIQRALEG